MLSVTAESEIGETAVKGVTTDGRERKNGDYSGPGLPQSFLVSSSRTDQTLFF